MNSRDIPQTFLSDYKDPRFLMLVLSYMDQNISPKGYEELTQKLRQDSNYREAFVALSLQIQQIKELGAFPCFIGSFSQEGSVPVFPDESDGDLIQKELQEYQAILQALGEIENTAPSIVMPENKPETETVQKVDRAKTIYKFNKTSLFTIITSAAAVLLIFLFARFAPPSGGVLVGQLTRTVDAQWENVSGAITTGCDLRTGPMSLVKGFAEITFEGGAKVVLEAPAEVTLESPQEIYVAAGKIVAKIDRGSKKAFIVRSPYGSIVDYGTEFGVRVDTGEIRTYVFQGEVSLRDSTDPVKSTHALALKAGEGGRAKINQEVEKATVNELDFVRSEEFEIRHRASAGSAYDRWKVYSIGLRKDPSLAAYYTFEKNVQQPETLPNLSASGAALNGTLKGQSLPEWVEGRWPQKTALAFDRSQRQYVEAATDARFCINGPVTVAAWVYYADARDGGHIVSNRIPPKSLCNYQLGYRSPSASDWKHSIHLARKLKSDDYKNQIYSRVLPDTFGWMLVAATHDNETVKFYLNGSLVDSRAWPQKQELAEAMLLIGSDYAFSDVSRFNGKIDEIAILKRVLTDSEMAQMYQAGKP